MRHAAAAGSSLPSLPDLSNSFFARRAVPPLTVIRNAADVAFEKMPRENLCNKHRRAQAQRHMKPTQLLCTTNLATDTTYHDAHANHTHCNSYTALRPRKPHLEARRLYRSPRRTSRCGRGPLPATNTFSTAARAALSGTGTKARVRRTQTHPPTHPPSARRSSRRSFAHLKACGAKILREVI